MEIDQVQWAELERAARAAADRSYAPYSRFPVGAALLSADGSLFAASNVENASFGLSICAERAAVFRAVAEGCRHWVALLVYTPTPVPTPPCGACLQVLVEFAAGAEVYCICDSEEVLRSRLDELLPVSFGPPNLAAKPTQP